MQSKRESKLRAWDQYCGFPQNEDCADKSWFGAFQNQDSQFATGSWSSKTFKCGCSNATLSSSRFEIWRTCVGLEFRSLLTTVAVKTTSCSFELTCQFNNDRSIPAQIFMYKLRRCHKARKQQGDQGGSNLTDERHAIIYLVHQCWQWTARS